MFLSFRLQKDHNFLSIFFLIDDFFYLYCAETYFSRGGSNLVVK